jgi:large subunit ribosomal protein L28
MARVCEVCGKKTTFGNQITRRGKAKYLGGVGTKITGINARKFKPNLQKVRAVVNGTVTRVKVCTQCMRNGAVVKPAVRPAEFRNKSAAAATPTTPGTPTA